MLIAIATSIAVATSILTTIIRVMLTIMGMTMPRRYTSVETVGIRVMFTRRAPSRLRASVSYVTGTSRMSPNT